MKLTYVSHPIHQFSEREWKESTGSSDELAGWKRLKILFFCLQFACGQPEDMQARFPFQH